MNIHEYQAKQLLRDYGVAVPNGGVAFSVDEAASQAEQLGGPVYVVKSQIHAGGRGAGKFQDNPDGKGGVRVVKSLDEVRESAGEMLGHVLDSINDDRARSSNAPGSFCWASRWRPPALVSPMPRT